MRDIDTPMSVFEDISVKIVVVGEPAVGKTTLRINYIGKSLSEEDYMMTLGADISESKIHIDNQTTLDIQIWDLAGQENFIPLTRQYMQGAQGAIIIFDLTRPDTFDSVNNWIEMILEENPGLDSNIPFIILGNKADLEGFIKADDEVVQTYVDYLNRHHNFSKTDVEYIKTSAKTGYQVTEAFKRLGEIMIENYRLSQGLPAEDPLLKKTEEKQKKTEISSAYDEVSSPEPVSIKKLENNHVEEELVESIQKSIKDAENQVVDTPQKQESTGSVDEKQDEKDWTELRKKTEEKKKKKEKDEEFKRPRFRWRDF